MLHDFISTNRETIISQARARIASRIWPSVSTAELEHGVPLFLTQLSETLRLEFTTTPFPDGAIGSAAAQHGGELLGQGFNVSQVVYDYGDICQTVTELAVELNAPITVEEFQTLNRCLDNAIAGAVTEHTRITAQTRSAEELERLGQSAHDLRDILNTAILAFHALKRGAVAINGSTGAVLGRSLMSLRDLIDRTLSEVRLSSGHHLRERLPVITFLDEIAAIGVLHAEYRNIRFRVEPVNPALSIDVDPQLLASAVMNLVHNAFKHTPVDGRVALRAFAESGRLVIEVEDQCGGIPDAAGDLFQPFGEHSGTARAGLGLGLSIARKAARSHNGDITVRNLPGCGCVFVLDLPLAAETVGVRS